MSAAREKVVFSHHLEMLIKVLGRPPRPEHVEGLLALGVNVHQLEPTYPREQYNQVIEYIIARLWPERSREEKLFELGRALAGTFHRTTIGRAVMRWLHSLGYGPSWTIRHAYNLYGVAGGFTQEQLSLRGPGHYELWFAQLEQPDLFRGVLTEALGQEDRLDLRVSVLSRDAGSRVTLRITWTEPAKPTG